MGKIYKNLVFEGNGAIGVAYCGAIKALEEKGLRKNVQRVCGTSSGSIMSLLVSLNLPASDIEHTYMDLNFKKVLDGGLTGIYRLVTQFGFFKGDHLENMCREKIAGVLGNPHATFRDFHRSKKCLPLSVIVCNLSKGKSEVFSYETTPDFEVAKAVRMSFSIPFVFAQKKYLNDYYTDGGIIRAYGIEYFDNLDKKNGLNINKSETLGFYLDQRDTFETDKVKGIVGFSKALAYIVTVYQQYDDLLRTESNKKRTVFIDSLGIFPFDFNLSNEKKSWLITQGYNDTMNYLNTSKKLKVA